MESNIIITYFFKICIIIVFFYLFNDLIRGKPENMQITLFVPQK